MKVRVEADGSMEFDITGNGDAAAAVELVRRLRAAAGAPVLRDAASLTPLLLETWEVVSAHPEGCHHRVVAEYLSLTMSAANSRCQELLKKGFAERIGAGVYKPM